MSWQRPVRIAVAVVGLGCAAAIYFYARPRTPAPPPPAPLAEIDPRASLEGGSGEILHGKGASEVRITFSGSRRYDDGRTVFTDVRLEGLDEDGLSVRADVVETEGGATGDVPTRYRLNGNVVVTTDDGLTVETGHAVLDQDRGHVSLPGALAFRRGRMSGTGTGATYERATETMTVEQDAVAVVAPGLDGKGHARATAQRMLLVRNQQSLQLDGAARIVSEHETLTADRATFLFTEDERAIKFLELRGRARVVPARPAERPALSADNITMSFHADGLTLEHATLTGQARLAERGESGTKSISATWIDLFMAADGRTLTAVTAKDRVVVELPPGKTSPGRRITATLLSAKGDDRKGLTSALFEGAPAFEETPANHAGGQTAPLRAGTATALVLALGGDLEAIDRAEFRQRATFRDGDVTAWADLAIYEERKGRLSLSPNAHEPRRLSRVVNADLTVDAESIEVATGTEDLTARGQVTTRTTRARDAKKGGGLFDGEEPIVGSAAQLTYRSATKVAEYVGGVSLARLRQGASEVAGDRIEYSDADGRLRATGHVTTVWQLADVGMSQTETLKTYRVDAETFLYEESRRVAVYDGSPVRMVSDDGEMESGRLTFTLLPDRRALDTLRADSNGAAVYGTWSGGYEATGVALTYRAATRRYQLEGKPARIKAPESEGAARCTLHESLQMEFDRVSGAVRLPGGGQAPRTIDQVPCATSIRKGR